MRAGAHLPKRPEVETLALPALGSQRKRVKAPVSFHHEDCCEVEMNERCQASPPGGLLHDAAAKGDLARIAALLAEGQTPDAMDSEGHTALHVACASKQAASAQLLIERHAALDALDNAGNTPLMLAAAGGSTTLVERLLAAGANIGVRNQRGQDALVLASIADHADVSRLLRDWLLAMRGMAASAAASSAGVQFDSPPSDKKGVFTGGIARGTGELPQPTPTSEKNRQVAEQMKRNMPLSTFCGWLKQVDPTGLNPMGVLALDYAFPYFLDFLDFSEDQTHNVLTRKGYGVSSFVKSNRARRFACDQTLPRGRYYTVCKDGRGNDDDTLQAELWAYYRPEHAGDIAMVDSANEKMLREFEQSGVWTLPRLSTPYIGIIFAPSQHGGNPFGQLVGVDFPNALCVVLPVTIQEARVERVLDLRQPETADWFAYYFSRVVVGPDDSDGVLDWMRCCPYRPALDSIEQMLPTLLSQERGGGMFGQMVGCWLRKHGVNGLIFPSVRNDPSVELQGGQVVDWRGWNFVDYRDAPEPYFAAFFDISDYWEENVRIGLGLGVGQLPDWDPYFSVRVEYVKEGHRRGSWRVDGTIAVRLAIIQQQLDQMRSAPRQERSRSFSWIDSLPLAGDVKEWVKIFVAQEYSQCASRGIALLPHIDSFEILQMFLISLSRLGTQQVGREWAADEVLEQLGPQVFAHHEHLPELHTLLAITLGALDPDMALAATEDRTARCRIRYYAAARLISQGLSVQARPYLDASIESPGECLEAHLALAERDALGSAPRSAGPSSE